MISLLCGLDSGVRLLLSSAMLLCLYTYFSTDGRLTRGRAECPKTPVFVRYREGPLGWVSPAARRFPSGPSASVCGLMRRGFYRKKKNSAEDVGLRSWAQDPWGEVSKQWTATRAPRGWQNSLCSLPCLPCAGSGPRGAKFSLFRHPPVLCDRGGRTKTGLGSAPGPLKRPVSIC